MKKVLWVTVLLFWEKPYSCKQGTEWHGDLGTVYLTRQDCCSFSKAGDWRVCQIIREKNAVTWIQPSSPKMIWSNGTYTLTFTPQYVYGSRPGRGQRRWTVPSEQRRHGRSWRISPVLSRGAGSLFLTPIVTAMTIYCKALCKAVSGRKSKVQQNAV